MSKGDIGLFIEDGKFGVKIEDGDLKGDEGLETAVAISLFTDQRVTDEELPQGEDSKRGWWGDLFSDIENDQIGSKLWTLARSKRIDETLRKAEDYSKAALRWMIEDGIAARIDAVASFQDQIAVGFWRLDINILKPSGTTSRYQVFWDAQKVIRG